MKNIVLLLMALIITLNIISCENNKPDYITDESATGGETTDIKNPANYHINGRDSSFKTSSDKPAPLQITIYNGRGRAIYNEPYIYLITLNMIYRYNQETNNVTLLCSDPLCLHNTKDCPFFNMIMMKQMFIHDNNIYYYKLYTEIDEKTFEIKNEIKFVEYNINTNHLTEIWSVPTGVTYNSQLFDGDYLYYIRNNFNEKNEVTYDVCRLNLNNLSIETLKYLGDNPLGILTIIDGNLYLCDEIQTIYFKIGQPVEEKYIKFPNVLQYIARYEDTFFYLANENDELHLYSMDKEMQNAQKLCDENINYYFITDNYIYNTIKDDKVIGKDQYGDILVLNSDIYRIKHDGTGKELVFTMPENMQNYYIECFSVVGNYIYGDYIYKDVDQNKSYFSLNTSPYDIMRIDLTTGEIYYISP